MRIRIKFRKYGVMRFIGHLDIMRYFQKAMRVPILTLLIPKDSHRTRSCPLRHL